jgi:hypothetical protein
MPVHRRQFLLSVAATQKVHSRLPPVRQLTRGPRYHWFGYYDKLQFDPSGRYVLGMEAGFEHRSPKPDDVVKVGIIDTGEGYRWIELGESRAWNWQQGCMLQWLPGSKDEVLWNDRAGGEFVCHVMNVRTRDRRTIPSAIYAVSPDASWAVSCDFRRLNDCRPGYGYAGIADPNSGNMTPDDAGVWKIDPVTGKKRLIVSIADAARIPYPPGYSKGAKHWFNHLLISPDGGRFIFLHRWRGEKEGRGFSTRLFTAGADGSQLHVLDPNGKTSHFIWRDPRTVLAWAWHPSHGEKFYLFQDRTDKVEAVAPDLMPVNGHCTYLPGNPWILNDTYPDKDRLQHVYLYDTQTLTRHPLGDFHSPPEYTGEWRCDTHPRFSPDGRKVVIDSAHNGGRQLYLIDVSAIVG